MSANYKSSYYEWIKRVEKTHFWFRARNRLLAKLVRRYLPRGNQPTFLEIGFGTGSVLRLLEHLGLVVTGIDLNHQALTYARENSAAKLFQSSIFTFQPRKQFSAVGAFDVLEHIGDDVRFLRRCRTFLAPGGYLFLTVPAGRWLWSQIDALSGHKRRYEMEELSEKLGRAGFSLVFGNYWQLSTLPIYWLWRRFRANQPSLKSYLVPPPKLLNHLFWVMLIFEANLIWRLSLPLGATIVVAARREDNHI